MPSHHALSFATYLIATACFLAPAGCNWGREYVFVVLDEQRFVLSQYDVKASDVRSDSPNVSVAVVHPAKVTVTGTGTFRIGPNVVEVGSRHLVIKGHRFETPPAISEADGGPPDKRYNTPYMSLLIDSSGVPHPHRSVPWEGGPLHED
jgi:hypothetical protein